MKQKKSGVFSTLFRWGKRGVMGPAKEVDAMAVEEIVSPGRQILRDFKSRKLAMFCVFVMIFMFALAFIGPLFVPLDLNYTETRQQNVAPGFDMLNVPKALANDVKTISSYASFSLGLSNSGDVYVWGNTSLGTTGIDVADIPQAVQDANILFAAAGYDHCIAIDDQGNVYGWGDNKLGQYPGSAYTDRDAPVAEILPDAKVDIDNVKDVKCGYQSTAILFKDGTAKVFGNSNTCLNMRAIMALDNIADVSYTNAYLLAVTTEGKFTAGNLKGLYDTVNGDPNLSLARYVGQRKVEAIAATSGTACLMLVDPEADAAATNDTERAAAREVIFTGSFNYGEKNLPALAADEYFIQIGGGTNHYTGLTNKGNVYGWGSNHLKQLNIPGSAKNGDKLIVTSFQNYMLKEDSSIQAKWGLSGYLFGTDGHGADVFARCVHGGKMTMTVGAVAHTAGELVGILLGHNVGVRDFHIRQHFHHFFGSLFLAHMLVNDKRLAYLPLHRKHRVQAGHGFLENDGDIIATNVVQLPLGYLGQVLALKHNPAAVNIAIAVQQLQNTHGRHGLAGAGFAHDAQGLSLFHGVGDTVDRLNNAFLRAEESMQVLKFQ